MTLVPVSFTTAFPLFSGICSSFFGVVLRFVFSIILDFALVVEAFGRWWPVLTTIFVACLTGYSLVSLVVSREFSSPLRVISIAVSFLVFGLEQGLFRIFIIVVAGCKLCEAVTEAYWFLVGNLKVVNFFTCFSLFRALYYSLLSLVADILLIFILCLTPSCFPGSIDLVVTFYDDFLSLVP